VVDIPPLRAKGKFLSSRGVRSLCLPRLLSAAPSLSSFFLRQTGSPRPPFVRSLQYQYRVFFSWCKMPGYAPPPSAAPFFGINTGFLFIQSPLFRGEETVPPARCLFSLPLEKDIASSRSSGYLRNKRDRSPPAPWERSLLPFLCFVSYDHRPRPCGPLFLSFVESFQRSPVLLLLAFTRSSPPSSSNFPGHVRMDDPFPGFAFPSMRQRRLLRLSFRPLCQ